MTTTGNKEARIDKVLKILANRHRRLAIRFLADTTDGVASYAELADHLAASGSQKRETVRIYLHHAMLPTLEAANIVEYDPRGETVRYQPDPFVEGILETVESEPPENSPS